MDRTIAYDVEYLKKEGITFDYATPQPWFDLATKETGINPMGNVVWAYLPDTGSFGGPLAITEDGVSILGILRAQGFDHV